MLNVYERFFSTSSELFLVTNGEDRIERVNPSWERVLGFRPDEVEGRSLSTFTHPDDRVENSRIKEVLLRHGSFRNFENRGVHKDGRIVWLRWFGHRDPQTGYIYATAKDITAERTAEKNLGEIVHDAFDAIEFERTISRISPMAIYRVDLQGNLYYANEAWEKIAGISMQEAMGLGWLDAVHPEDRARLNQLRNRKVEEREPGPLELRFRHPDGKIVWMAVTSAVLRGPDGVPVGSTGAGLNITSIKENEQRLQALNENLNLIIEAGGHGTWVWSLVEGKITGDSRWCELTGADPERGELDISKMEAILHEDDLALAYRAVDDYLSGRRSKYEALVRWCNPKTGKHAWVLTTGRITATSACGEPTEISGFAVNITAQKEAEAELDRNRRLLDAFLRFSPSAMFVKDGSGKILLDNENYRNRISVFSSDPTPAEVQSSAVEKTYEEVHRQLDGEHTYLSSTFPLFDEFGEIYGTGGIKTDISDLVRERERASLLEKLIESSRDGFGYCDPSGRPLYLNRFLTEGLGWKLSEASLFDHLSEKTAKLFATEILPVVIGEEGQWEGEVEYLDRNSGEIVPIWQRCFCARGSDGKPRHIAFFATDLRTKRKSEAAILHSSKMASLGQMAAGVAHEVNNPITIIHGTAGLLKKAIGAERVDLSKLRAGIDRIEKTALRISRIVRGLRTFSRSGENDHPTSIPLREIVEDTLDLCRERFRDHSIELRIAPIPDLSLRCRPTQISQVILNLLNNGFDAVAESEDRWVELEIVPVADKVVIMVTDSGSGISDEIRSRLMEPFFTTKDPGKGTGLGLPISRGIVEEHGGRLSYDPANDHTRFKVELPFSAPKENHAQPSI